MATVPKPHYTVEEYLALEQGSNTKHEYCNGEIFAMVGATEPHVLIATNVAGELRAQQRKGRRCRVYSSDLRVKAGGLYTYPDVSVVCGERRFDKGRRDTLLNPKLIVEVLSKSTEDYDRGTKFDQYKKIDTFEEYLLIAQDTYRVEHYMRQPDGQWLLTVYTGPEEVVPLASIGSELKLADVYEMVELENEPDNES